MSPVCPSPKFLVKLLTNDIETMYRQGDPIWLITHETGFSVGMIYRILHSRDVPLRQPRSVA